jgi:hypothetical protein
MNTAQSNGPSRDARIHDWLGDGGLHTDAKAPWHEMTSLPGGYGMYPTNPTTQRTVAGVVAAIAVTALFAWGAAPSKNHQPDHGATPVVKK